MIPHVSIALEKFAVEQLDKQALAYMRGDIVHPLIINEVKMGVKPTLSSYAPGFNPGGGKEEVEAKEQFVLMQAVEVACGAKQRVITDIVPYTGTEKCSVKEDMCGTAACTVDEGKAAVVTPMKKVQAQF